MSLDELREEMAFNLFLADEIRSGVWDAFVVFLRFRSEGAVVVLEQLDGIGYRKDGDPGPMALARESIKSSAERFVSAMAALPEVGAFRRAVVVYRYFGSEYATHWEMFVDEEAEHVIVSPATWYQIAEELNPFAEGVLDQVPLEADLPPRAVNGGGLGVDEEQERVVQEQVELQNKYQFEFLDAWEAHPGVVDRDWDAFGVVLFGVFEGSVVQVEQVDGFAYHAGGGMEWVALSRERLDVAAGNMMTAFALGVSGESRMAMVLTVVRETGAFRARPVYGLEADTWHVSAGTRGWIGGRLNPLNE